MESSVIEPVHGCSQISAVLDGLPTSACCQFLGCAPQPVLGTPILAGTGTIHMSVDIKSSGMQPVACRHRKTTRKWGVVFFSPPI